MKQSLWERERNSFKVTKKPLNNIFLDVSLDSINLDRRNFLPVESKVSTDSFEIGESQSSEEATTSRRPAQRSGVSLGVSDQLVFTHSPNSTDQILLTSNHHGQELFLSRGPLNPQYDSQSDVSQHMSPSGGLAESQQYTEHFVGARSPLPQLRLSLDGEESSSKKLMALPQLMSLSPMMVDGGRQVNYMKEYDLNSLKVNHESSLKNQTSSLKKVVSPPASSQSNIQERIADYFLVFKKQCWVNQKITLSALFFNRNFALLILLRFYITYVYNKYEKKYFVENSEKKNSFGNIEINSKNNGKCLIFTPLDV